MQLTLRIEGSSAEEEARSLYDWLLLDRAFLRGAQIEMGSSAPAIPGHQGSAFDLVSLVISSAISSASLGVSIASWRSTRPQEPSVTVERADGSKVKIEHASREEAQHLITQLLGDNPHQ
ncbi:hypothetical protein ACGFYE_40500 [Streptomyces zaomyceticus]|uniref:effector-associated constant component EACC1 n=1 Tax=Streptomyces zaomyceticus TaxID=68286 RepID=UPI003717CD3B